MQVRTLDSVTGTDRAVEGPTFVSRRLLLAKDEMGFSMHDTLLYAGTVTKMWYQNHLEAVYCIEGEGTLEDLESGEIHTIRPGTLYALDKHDRHVLTATADLRMVCVFNPPLVGSEVHDENGSYPLLSQ
ncbi:MAG: ectoine synthase [Actinomycetota bacterium]